MIAPRALAPDRLQAIQIAAAQAPYLGRLIDWAGRNDMLPSLEHGDLNEWLSTLMDFPGAGNDGQVAPSPVSYTHLTLPTKA